jgi:hypothetical protein
MAIFSDTPRDIVVERSMQGHEKVAASWLRSNAMDDDEFIDGLVAASEYGVTVYGNVSPEEHRAALKRKISGRK